MPINEGITFAGTEIAISAAIPETIDAAGFAAVTGYAVIGEVSSAPGSGGKTFEDVAYTVLNKRATIHKKGTSDQAEQTMEVVVIRGDEGQELAKEALDSDNYYSFRVTYNSGEIDYFLARVTGYEGEGGDSNTIRMATITFRRSPDGVIEVAA